MEPACLKLGHPYTPLGFPAAVEHWSSLRTSERLRSERRCLLRAGTLSPHFSAAQHLPLHFSNVIAFSRSGERGSRQSFDVGGCRLSVRQVNRCKLAPHRSRTPRGSAVLPGLGTTAGNCLGRFHPDAQQEQLRAVRRADCRSSTIAPQSWLCLVPAWSHGLDEHSWQSPDQLRLAAMCWLLVVSEMGR